MSLESDLKSIIAWNIKAFEHLLIMFKDSKSPDAEIIKSVLYAGFKQNFYLLRTINHIAFIPGDEETAEVQEQNLLDVSSQIKAEQAEEAEKAKLDEKSKKDVDELERMFKLDETSSKPEASNPTDWYNNLFKPKGEKIDGIEDDGAGQGGVDGAGS